MTYRFSPDEVRLDSAVFGPALQRVRAALGVSQKELGHHALIGASTVATYETGARDPSPETLVGVLVACGVEPWSAAQHCRLLAAETALETDAAGVPFLRLLTHAPSPSAALGRPTPVLTSAMAVTLGAAVVATAVRGKRRQERQFEMLDQKLLAKALTASPVAQAEDLGLYALVERPPRSVLLRHIASVAEELSDDELMAVIAAIHARGSGADDGAASPS